MCSICILDFETTGLNPEVDEIIEYAIKIHNNDTSINNYVKPNFMEITEKITEITSITPEIVEEQGITQLEACEHIEKFITNNNIQYILAHNGHRFDYLFLKNLFKRNYKVLPNIKYVDTIHIFKDILKKNSYSQKSLCEHYGIVQNNAHRAIGDVIDLSDLCLKAGISINHLNDHSRNVSDVKDMHGILHTIELFKNSEEKENILYNLNSKERRLIHMYVEMFNKKNNVKYEHITDASKTKLIIKK
uniref:Exonuclease domain-containing protein n=1 Tax=viral metagenome TaxID=1070528 RepID=A0A6C0CYU2_9ZZZZ